MPFGIFPSDEVLDLITQTAQGNIRALEGSLNRVLAFTQTFRLELTLENVKQAFKDIEHGSSVGGNLTPAFIIGIVAECHKLYVEDLMSRKRDKATALARGLAMYFLRKETNLSLSQIGVEVGNRDAAAVTNAYKKISQELVGDGNSYLKRLVANIEERLKH